MMYLVKRTYLTRLGIETTMKVDRRTDYVEASSAGEAASQFLTTNGCKVIGDVASFPDDTALATCVREGVTYVIRVAPIGNDAAALKKMGEVRNLGRRSTDQKLKTDQ